jgi:hypothetical protein
VGQATGFWQCTHNTLLDALEKQRPITIILKEPAPPMPSAKQMKKASMKQETRVAEDMGGQRQRGSGAVPWRKGDGVVKGKYRIENKTRFTKGITITREELSKIRGECGYGEVPLFQVNFTNQGTCMVEDQWILVPYEHWKKVLSETSDD